MHKKKAILAVLLAMVLVLLQVVVASAAPLSQDGTISGTVQDVNITTNTSGATVVQVTLDDGSTYDLSVDSAANLGLVTYDTNGDLVVADGAVGMSVDITPDMLQADPCVLPDGANQPVGEALTSYFCSGGIDYNTLEGYHEAGMGYGVIAQACFMAQQFGVTCQSILDAKAAQQVGDGFSFTLADGTVITNWGQLRKAAFIDGVDKSLNNLGAIMSGRADTGNTPTATTNTSSENRPSNGKNHSSHAGGNGKGKGH